MSTRNVTTLVHLSQPKSMSLMILQSLASRSNEAATLGAQGQPLDRNAEDIRRAGELSAEDLRGLARKYLDPDKAYLMRVTPGES